MKKLTALLLSALLCLSLLAGCQQGAEETKNPTCEEVLTAIQEAIGEDNLPMMGEIDDETLSVLYGFEPTELLEDYRGHSLLVFSSLWSIDYTIKRNPGLELSETLSL